MGQPAQNLRVQRQLIYDVGMHRGEDTNYYLKKGFRVVAFEADPELAEGNRRRFLSEIESGRLVIVEGAIVDDPKTKTVRFFKNLDNTVWGTVDPEWAARNEEKGAHNEVIEVSTVDFSNCLATHGIPYYLKIDIEGADFVCLNALRGFGARPYYLSIESEKVDFEKLVCEFEVLSELGYTRFKAIQQANIHQISLPKHSYEGDSVSYAFARGASGMFGRDLPGIWLTDSEALSEYKKIFAVYERFGDATIWHKNRLANIALRLASKMLGRSIPGWYDTHARHADCEL